MNFYKNYWRKSSVAIIVVMAFWLTFNFGYYVRWTEAVIGYGFTDWGRLIFRESSKVIFVFLVTLPIAKIIGGGSVFTLLGIDKNPLPGFFRAIISVLPMFIGYAALFSFSADFNLYGFFSGSFFPGLTEELIYRSFFFGIFFYQLKVGFIPSILIVSAVFGYMHFSQSDVLLDSFFIFMITALGSALFAWLYVEWGRDLWVPIFLHMLMNLAWGTFDTGTETALGGWGLNLFRVITIVTVIYLTVRKIKRTEDFLIGRLWKWAPSRI